MRREDRMMVKEKTNLSHEKTLAESDGKVKGTELSEK